MKLKFITYYDKTFPSIQKITTMKNVLESGATLRKFLKYKQFL